MKTRWLLSALVGASLAMAQEPPHPPPAGEPPRGEQPPPPPPGQPPSGPEAERPPLPPPPPERRGGPEQRDRLRHPLPPPEPMQDFETSVQREIGPQMETLKEFGGGMLKEGIEQARRLFQQRRFEEGRDLLRGLGRQLRELRELKERDPERFKLQQKIAELDRRSIELGQKIRRAGDEDAKKQASGELKSLLNDLFDLRQQEREKNVQQIERDLKELRAALDQRKAKRDEIIQHRFDQLTGKAEMLEW